MMTNAGLLNRSANAVSFLDYGKILGVTAGTLIRNDHLGGRQMHNFILEHCSRTGGARRPKIVKIRQKHSNRIVEADSYLGAPADGIYTSTPALVPVIRTADCLPLFLTDGETVALIHLGWRGILLGIIDRFFAEVAQLNIAGARAVVGPGIGKCCFEMSPEARLLFDRQYRVKINQKNTVDLESLVVDELAKHGLKYIYKSEACTYCEEDKYYSYRREGNDVRHMYSFICKSE